MFKKVFFQIHWFLGITAGLILSIMGVTGAIYSYEQPIQKLFNPNSYTVQVENKAKLTPAEIYQYFHTHNPEIKINSITVAQAPEEASNINIVKEGARKGYTMMLNPYTAEILPEIKGKAFFQFIQQLHRNLTAGEFGKQITGAATLMLIFFVLSGLYLRWPKKHTLKQWLAIKPKLSGRNFLWDLHAVVGTWVIIFYLLLACTGLYWSYDWWRSGMFKVLGVEQPKPAMQAGHDGKPNQAKEQQTIQASNSTANNLRSRANNANSEQQNADINAKDKGLTEDQIQIALAQTWNGFNSQIKRDYSTLTISIPKKSDGKIELSFVDKIPQHERARNTATYNYQTLQIEKLKLYESKALNEKIMSSMLPVHRGSFFGPVYQFFVMLAALAMPLFFVTGWMLYLKRRKQKKLTLAAKQSGTVIGLDSNTTPWLIVFASQTGLAEQLAWRTASSLQEAKLPTSVKAIQQLTMDDLNHASHILFIASTYGTGEAPDLALSFEKKLMSSTLNLPQLSYAVLALGSQDYPETYCQFGQRIDAWLKKSGAQALFNRIEVNNASNEDIQRWNLALVEVTQLNLSSMSIQKTFDEWRLTKRELINPDSLGAPAFNIELQTQNQIHWQAGDIAEVQTGNSAQRIQNFLNKHQVLDQFIDETLTQPLEELLLNRDLTVDVQPFEHLADLLDQLPLLPTREYSIASIPQQNLLRLVVRQQHNQQGELGLGSGWLTEHISLRDSVKLRIRTNESFHLIDDHRPIICIGNGTGIAGLMSLIHARVCLGYAENWLIFGERQHAKDYFFKDTVQEWQNLAMLSHLDLAFSRDQVDKIYVSHKLQEQSERLKQWIANDAVIYVCGSINGMASDVDQVLNEILCQETVEQLRLTGRYRRDVY